MWVVIVSFLVSVWVVDLWFFGCVLWMYLWVKIMLCLGDVVWFFRWVNRVFLVLSIWIVLFGFLVRGLRLFVSVMSCVVRIGLVILVRFGVVVGVCFLMNVWRLLCLLSRFIVWVV